MTIARHLSIHGRVQGVGYRAWVEDEADSLGLSGWVRNRRDGTVEAVVSPAVSTATAAADGPAPFRSVEEHALVSRSSATPRTVVRGRMVIEPPSPW